MDAIYDSLVRLTETVAFFGGFRVFVAAVLGILLGVERTFSNKDAGLRTYGLVSAGSALFTVLSIEGFGAADTSRVAAQIVTGIGFLGAGLIFRQGANVQGLTTAAGLWTVAAVGMAAGTGHWGLAIVATLIVLLILKGSDRFSTQLRERSLRDAEWSVRMTVKDPATIEDLRSLVTDLAPSAARALPDVGHWAVGSKKGDPTISLILNERDLNQLIPLFEAHNGVSKIRIHEHN